MSMPDGISRKEVMTPRERQDREIDEGIENVYVRSSSVDRSWWIKSAYVLEKYRLVVLGIGAVIGAFGFGFTTPKEHYEEITKAQNTILIHQLRADSNIVELTGTLKILVAAQCMERSRTELAFMQLDCARYIQYRVDNPSARGKP